MELLANVSDHNVSVANNTGHAETIPAIYTDLLNVLVTYVAPFFFVVGVIGNTLTFFVFLLKQYRGKLHAMLYRNLALVDFLVLIVYDGLHTMPKLFGGGLLTYNDLSCKIIPTLYLWLRAVSAWILVIVALERFIGVLYPLRARVFSNTRNFRLIRVFATIALLALYAPLLVTSGIKYLSKDPPWAVCTTSILGNPCFWYGNSFFHWMNLVMASLLPFSFIVAFNSAIMLSILRSRARRKQMIAINPTMLKKTRLSSKVATLLAISVTFIVLTLPNPIIYLMEMYLIEKNTIEFLKVVIVSAILPVLDTINHAINIAFYCLCDKKFRTGLKSILCCFHVTYWSKLCEKLKVRRRNDNSLNSGSYDITLAEQTSTV